MFAFRRYDGAVAAELTVGDTNGILQQPWVRPKRTSRGFGWEQLYVSTQREQAYEASFAGARSHLVILHLVLAAQLARHHSVCAAATTPAPVRSGLTDRQLHSVRDLIEARLAEPLSLRDLAAVTGLSVSQFARQFRVRTGVAPHQLLIRRRIEAACLLLRRTTMPIAEVAQRCGFSHQEHLTRVLRARLDVTPAAMRASCSAFVQDSGAPAGGD